MEIDPPDWGDHHVVWRRLASDADLLRQYPAPTDQKLVNFINAYSITGLVAAALGAITSIMVIYKLDARRRSGVFSLNGGLSMKGFMDSVVGTEQVYYLSGGGTIVLFSHVGANPIISPMTGAHYGHY